MQNKSRLELADYEAVSTTNHVFKGIKLTFYMYVYAKVNYTVLVHGMYMNNEMYIN